MAISDAVAAIFSSTVGTPAKSASTGADSAAFSQTLSTIQAKDRAQFMSGRIGIDLNSRGEPASVAYYSADGQLQTSSTFNAESILRHTNQLGIDLQDLKSLGQQLDAAGVGYRPYELYKGTGSNHGIDFDNLIAGGLGTVYDWRQDSLAGQKGPYAQQYLTEAQALAAQLKLGQTSQAGNPAANVASSAAAANAGTTASAATTAQAASSETVTDTAAAANAAANAGDTASTATTAQPASTDAASQTDAATLLQSLLQNAKPQQAKALALLSAAWRAYEQRAS